MSRELNKIIDFHYTVGDTEPSIGLQLVVRNSAGVLSVFDLTDYTMTYEAIDDSDDSEHVSETSTGITNTDAENGKVSIDPTAIAATAGTYWVRVYGTASGERRSFPPDGRRIRVTVDDGV